MSLTRSGNRSVLMAVPAGAFDHDDGRMLRLAGALRANGCAVEVFAASLDPSEPWVAPTLDVEAARWFPSPPIGLVGRPLGPRPRERLCGWELRRWLGARVERAIIIGHPELTHLLHHDPLRRPAVVMLPSRRIQIGRGANSDLTSVIGWLVSDEEQAVAITTAYDRAAIVTGPLVESRALPPVEYRDHGAVVLLPDPGAWTSLDHGVEIAAKLAASELEVRWVAHTPDDAWLVRHDLRHLGHPRNIRLVDAAQPDLLIGAAVLARSGYRPFDSPLVLAARRSGLPVVGFSPETSPGLQTTEPFDVEGLVHSVVSLLTSVSPDKRAIWTTPGYGRDPDEVATHVIAWLSGTRYDTPAL